MKHLLFLFQLPTTIYVIYKCAIMGKHSSYLVVSFDNATAIYCCAWCKKQHIIDFEAQKSYVFTEQDEEVFAYRFQYKTIDLPIIDRFLSL